MATLPTLESPTFLLEVPSTGKEIKYRPYTVSEEKVMMISGESQDTRAIFSAIIDTINVCTFGVLDLDKLTLFDVEYLFLKIRGKSVGEFSTISIKCDSCDEMSIIDVNLDNAQVANKDRIKDKKYRTYMLNDSIGVLFTYPPANSIIQIENLDFNDHDSVIDVIVSSVDTVFDEETVYDYHECTLEQKRAFFTSIPNKKLTEIAEHFNTMPSVYIDVDCTCEHCGSNINKRLEGLPNFF